MKDFKLPMDFVDNFILKTNPDFALIYICAHRMRMEGIIPDSASICEMLSLKESTVKEGIKYWTDAGFDIFGSKKVPPTCEKCKYSPDEIFEFSQKDKDLELLYEEVEKILSKPLSTNDMQTIFWIYNDLGISSATIILMMNYAKSKDKCRMRYIEKTAMEWSEKGILEYKDAEKYIDEMEKAISYESRIKKLFGIDRNLISSEKETIAYWCNELKPSKDALIEAYEICIERIGKFSAKYINAILVNKKESGSSSRRGHAVPTPKSTKFNNFTSKTGVDYRKLELDALNRRLARTRGEKNAE